MASLYAFRMKSGLSADVNPSFQPEDSSRLSWHPHGRFVRVGDHVLHYVDLGDPEAPPLLLLHGYLLSSWTWRFNLEALAKHHRVIAPCHLGSGYSDRPREMSGIRDMTNAIAGLLDVLEIAKTSLVGLSMGGAVSLQLALDHPERVDRLILEDSAGVRWKVPAMLRRVPVWLAAQPLKLLPTRMLLKWILNHHVYENFPVDERYMEGLMRPLMASGTRECAIAVAKAMAHDVTCIGERLGQVTQETLILWGREDRILSLKVGRIFERRIPDSRLVIVDQCGHCPHEEYPERFNREVLDFLESGNSKKV